MAKRTYLLVIQAQPDVRPVCIRVRHALKHALRRLRLQCKKIVPIDPADVPVVVSRSTRRPRQKALPFEHAAVAGARELHHEIFRHLADGREPPAELREQLAELAARERG